MYRDDVLGAKVWKITSSSVFKFINLLLLSQCPGKPLNDVKGKKTS